MSLSHLRLQLYRRLYRELSYYNQCAKTRSFALNTFAAVLRSSTMGMANTNNHNAKNVEDLTTPLHHQKEKGMPSETDDLQVLLRNAFDSNSVSVSQLFDLLRSINSNDNQAQLIQCWHNFFTPEQLALRFPALRGSVLSVAGIHEHVASVIKPNGAACSQTAAALPDAIEQSVNDCVADIELLAAEIQEELAMKHGVVISSSSTCNRPLNNEVSDSPIGEDVAVPNAQAVLLDASTSSPVRAVYETISRFIFHQSKKGVKAEGLKLEIAADAERALGHFCPTQAFQREGTTTTLVAPTIAAIVYIAVCEHFEMPVKPLQLEINQGRQLFLVADNHLTNKGKTSCLRQIHGPLYIDIGNQGQVYSFEEICNSASETSKILTFEEDASSHIGPPERPEAPSRSHSTSSHQPHHIVPKTLTVQGLLSLHCSDLFFCLQRWLREEDRRLQDTQSKSSGSSAGGHVESSSAEMKKARRLLSLSPHWQKELSGPPHLSDPYDHLLFQKSMKKTAALLGSDWPESLGTQWTEAMIRRVKGELSDMRLNLFLFSEETRKRRNGQPHHLAGDGHRHHQLDRGRPLSLSARPLPTIIQGDASTISQHLVRRKFLSCFTTEYRKAWIAAQLKKGSQQKDCGLFWFVQQSPRYWKRFLRPAGAAVEKKESRDATSMPKEKEWLKAPASAESDKNDHIAVAACLDSVSVRQLEEKLHFQHVFVAGQ